MILVIDVGNTNITFGVFENRDLKATFHITTKLPRTSDEYGILLDEMLRLRGISLGHIEGTIIASVVSDVMHALTSAIRNYIGHAPLVVGPGVKTENPRVIGADRIADAVAAYEKYGGPVLVIDFGTGTTYDLVSVDGSFVAGISAPGMRISIEALAERTAMLPRIEIKKPKSILAQETVSSMQAGLFYGQIGQTEYIVSKVKEESGEKDLKVVATGGLGKLIAGETDSIQIYDSALTLDGLRMIYEKNKKQERGA